MSIEDIRRSAAENKLVVITGAGTSVALMHRSQKGLNWPGLIENGLDFCKQRGFISEQQKKRYIDQIGSGDIDELLGAAEFVGRKLNAPQGDSYSKWLRNVFEQWTPDAGGMQKAFRTISENNVPIATLNYDTLLEQSTGLPTVDFSDTRALMAWSRRELQSILHLHGVWSNPKECVFGIRDYERALNDQSRDVIQKSLSSLNRLLFIGCGDTFSDPNISNLIQWLRRNIGSGALQHYALVRDDEVDRKFQDHTWHGFVEPIGYGPAYTDLSGFLLSCFPTRQSPKASSSKTKDAAVQATRVIDSYRKFLLRDCGEMAIEGMPGDMDASQRKFDIEKLFVPLELIGIQPVLDSEGPENGARYKKWIGQYSSPIDFSNIFESTKKIALLALPGGGKTLLLKRLAVAYANPARRASSSDNLPALGLIPVLIRCREWKDHIRQPIPSLLRSMPNITGDNSLAKLMDVLEKHLRSGSVILLVDGLDEIHSDSDRAIFVENLEKFIESYPKIRLIVTSREAGFDLIAPCLNRFCAKFRIAPLNDDAIRSLCEHWHQLMGGGSPEAMGEASEVADALQHNDSLSNLAGNPLLCTMLLVVKHGFGRLPSDRVTLYDRAVELLLDTWNIKGHEALNVKEAVPQLACVAFELMKSGKQTATEKEILKILEDARAHLPMIGRYAKDSPHAFLKRVELRSSLVLQGGHTNEDGKIVPFYQFRHLTFQEYLSAVAAVEGYTLSSTRKTDLLKIIGSNLLSEEWKEVIPMAARLAKSQSGSLLDALVAGAESERKKFLTMASKASSKLASSYRRDIRMPAATTRITKAMVEEANFSPENLDKAAPIVALFANGCRGGDNWKALSQGPYGPDLRKAALNIYISEPYARVCLARNTVALLEAMAEPNDFWLADDCQSILMQRLDDSEEENLSRTLLAICGSFWILRSKSAASKSSKIYRRIEEHLFDNRTSVRIAASWAWGFWRHVNSEQKRSLPQLPNEIILRVVENLLGSDQHLIDLAGFMFCHFPPIERASIEMQLDGQQKRRLDGMLKKSTGGRVIQEDDVYLAILQTAFIIKGVVEDDNLAARIMAIQGDSRHGTRLNHMLRSLGVEVPPSTRASRRSGRALRSN